MSNPGVITLSQKAISHNKDFRVEDNLAESIHFHYNDIRIDLSIRELDAIAAICDESIYDLVKAKNFRLDDFDPDFLNSYSQYLMDLEEVSVQTIPAASLYSLETNALKLPVRRKIIACSTEYEDDCLPVIFNGEDTILYGKNTVADALAQGKAEISVLNLRFEKGKHSIPKTPWVDFLFKWDKKRLKKIAKAAAKRFFR